MQETQEMQVQFLGWKDSLEEKMQPIPEFMPGEAHEQRSLAGYSPIVAKSRTWLMWSSTQASILPGKYLTLSHFIFSCLKFLLCKWDKLICLPQSESNKMKNEKNMALCKCQVVLIIISHRKLENSWIKLCSGACHKEGSHAQPSVLARGSHLSRRVPSVPPARDPSGWMTRIFLLLTFGSENYQIILPKTCFCKGGEVEAMSTSSYFNRCQRPAIIKCGWFFSLPNPGEIPDEKKQSNEHCREPSHY